MTTKTNQTDKRQVKKRIKPKRTAYKDKLKPLFIKALKNNDGNITRACSAIHINRNTYYDWKAKDAKFSQDVGEVEESLIDLAENELIKLMKAGNITALIFYLKCKGKARGYIERQEIDMEPKHRRKMMKDENPTQYLNNYISRISQRSR